MSAKDRAEENDTKPAPLREEMQAVVKLRIGNRIRLTASARATPAGVAAAALVTAAVMVPLIWITRRR